MVIPLAGEWDVCRQDELRRRLAPAYAEPDVILDLTAAKYVTRTLVCALILAYNHREKHGMPRAIIAVRSAFVRRLLSVTGLDRLFRVFDTVEEAAATQPSFQ